MRIQQCTQDLTKIVEYSSIGILRKAQRIGAIYSACSTKPNKHKHGKWREPIDILIQTEAKETAHCANALEIKN